MSPICQPHYVSRLTFVGTALQEGPQRNSRAGQAAAFGLADCKASHTGLPCLHLGAFSDKVHPAALNTFTHKNGSRQCVIWLVHLLLSAVHGCHPSVELPGWLAASKCTGCQCQAPLKLQRAPSGESQAHYCRCEAAQPWMLFASWSTLLPKKATLLLSLLVVPAQPHNPAQLVDGACQLHDVAEPVELNDPVACTGSLCMPAVQRHRQALGGGWEAL